jgi:hypothetical protein
MTYSEVKSHGNNSRKGPYLDTRKRDIALGETKREVKGQAEVVAPSYYFVGYSGSCPSSP